ncbi:minor glycoprotein [Kibale red colobus virus 1]|uniref:Minor glycoprotein n=1 Tax=Kibale red colobus virus 1 TaxID=1885929 RepID=X2D5U5_9NIDO|nr:minor glycoprotein [Kibale red colobus virus 1]AHH53859.1 minor glycoprotein [Kibale red colobus virus 1]
MPISCSSLLAYLQWHSSSFSLRSISSPCISASRAWLFFYSCYLCLTVRAVADSSNQNLAIHLHSTALTFNVTLRSYGCYLLGSVEGGSQAKYNTCPNYGSAHIGSNQSGVIAESSAFNYELLIAAFNQTRKYPNLYNSTNVTVSCDYAGCNITRYGYSNNTPAGCTSHSFSFAEDTMAALLVLYLPPAILLATALFLAT